jgi:hypothetical protein
MFNGQIINGCREMRGDDEAVPGEVGVKTGLVEAMTFAAFVFLEFLLSLRKDNSRGVKEVHVGMFVAQSQVEVENIFFALTVFYLYLVTCAN